MAGGITHFLMHGGGTKVKGCEACVAGAPVQRETTSERKVKVSMRELRDEAARTALAAIIATSAPYPDPHASAKMAYAYADAMMLERGDEPAPPLPSIPVPSEALQ